MAGGPEDAAGDHVEVAIVGNGGGVVADGGAEDAGFLGAVLVDPNVHEIVGAAVAVAAFYNLTADGERRGGGKDFDVVVVLFANGCPIGEAVDDWICFVGEGDGDRFLRAVAAGLEAEVFEPVTVGLAEFFDGIVGVADAVAVHRAMEIYAGDTVAMGIEDAFDGFGIGNIGAAFVMDDDVVTFGVIGIAEDGERRMGAFVVGVDLIDDDVGAAFEALFEDVFLFGVFVAATAGDEQGADGFGGRCGESAGGNGNDGEQARHCHGHTDVSKRLAIRMRVLPWALNLKSGSSQLLS